MPRYSATQGYAKYGPQRKVFEKNRKAILLTQDTCAICGKLVDKSLRFPHPMSAAIDHIIPWDKGGDCSIDNLQLTHLSCNRAKSDKLFASAPQRKEKDGLVSNRNLPKTFDW